MSGKSAETVIARTLTRIEERNPALNCFTEVFREEALKYAQALDGGDFHGPLVGVPFAVKDQFDVKGRTTHAGSRIRANDPPAEHDATAVQRLRSAGAVLVGGCNMDEFALGFTTDNTHYGPTHNPHDETRTAGGSSGGSAAAIAAGLVPFALGSDTNGSVRVPAALCGVYGFKPTFGRVSRAGVAPLTWSLDHVGVLARTTRDVALVYDTIQGPDERDPVCTNRPTQPVLPTLSAGIGGLKIAIAKGHWGIGGLPEVFAGVENAARVLGANRRVEIPEGDRAAAASLMITYAEGASLHLEEIRTRAQDFDPNIRIRWIATTLIPSVWYQRAQRFRQYFREKVLAQFEDIDLLITPTTPFPAPQLGQTFVEIGGKEVPVRPTLGSYTAPFSFIGLPAISVPIAGGAAGLPLGVQIVGAPYQDESVLRAAAVLESEGVLLRIAVS